MKNTCFSGFVNWKMSVFIIRLIAMLQIVRAYNFIEIVESSAQILSSVQGECQGRIKQCTDIYGVA